MSPRRPMLELGSRADGSSFTVPVDVATESIGFLGQRGSGKSNAEVVLAEELWAHSVPWVAIDPKGDWWGIRSPGTGPGLPVPVLGGLRGDIPLEPDAGALVADVVFDQALTAVLDVSRMSGSELSRFLIAFCHRLFDRHQADPQVRTVIFEEAHRYIPQSVTGATAALKEATAKLPLEGRAFGLGTVVASQRSSRLHKDVLTQFSVLFAMRSPAKLDRDAIGGWVEEHGVSKELLASLPSLDNGEAWCWSPHTLDLVERVRFRRRSTFDSGATPKVGESRKGPRSLADVDLGVLKEQMSAAVERAKENDPRELTKRIRQLQRELDTARKSATVREVEVPVEVPVVDQRAVDLVRDALGVLKQSVDGLAALRERMATALAELGDAQPSRPVAPKAPAPARPVTRQNSTRETTNAVLTGPMRKLLTVLATYGPRSKRQLALQAGYAVSGGGFNNPLGALRSAGFVEGGKGGPIAATSLGLAALGDYDELPSGRALLEHWLSELRGPEKKILGALVDAGGALPKVELAARAGYEPSGGGFNNPLGRLRTLELVAKGEPVRLTDDFAEAIR